MGNQTSQPCDDGGEEAASQERQIFIEAFSDDMLKSNSVGVVVCFIDSDWTLSNNVFAKIFGKAGNRFVSSYKHLKHEHKSMEIGNVLEGDAGLLPSDYILFCVSCDREHSYIDEADDVAVEWTLEHLSVIVDNLLQRASELELNSMVIPFAKDYPNPHVEQLITALYCSFIKTKSTINELHLIAVDSELCPLMERVLSDVDKNIKSKVEQTPQQQTANEPDILHDSTEPQEAFGTAKEKSESSPKSENSQHERKVDDETIYNLFDRNLDRDFNSVAHAEDNIPSASVAGAGKGDSLPSRMEDKGVNSTNLTEQKGENCLKYKKKTEHSIDPALVKTFPHLNVEQQLFRSLSSGSDKEELLDFENILETDTGFQIEDENSEKVREKALLENHDICPICLQIIPEDGGEMLEKCQHKFCSKCLSEHFEKSQLKSCPVCRESYGTITGNQPENGIMFFREDNEHCLPGHQGEGVIIIDYEIPDGIQGPNHPHPGVPYKGARRTVFLPNSAKGQSVHRMLRLAFDRRLTFTVGTSVTSGKENRVTWNDIHHKTRSEGGPERFGYPDPGYLDRVIEDLKQKGITDPEGVDE